MGRSRPINRRPWRRAPWRKANRRPHRWIALNTTAGLGEDCVITEPWAVPCAASAGVSPAVTLAAGQVDVEPWADNQEVVVDRIVGQINLQGISYVTYTEAPALATAPATMVRLGMLVQEETDPTAAPFINLFSDEHVEDFEWMWLQEVVPNNWNYLPGSSTTGASGWGWTHTIDLDLRVKRKLGQTDNLLLYAALAIVADGNYATHFEYVTGSHLLRSVFVSK